MVDGRVIIQSQEAWAPAGGKEFPAGSLLSLDLAQLKANPARLKPTLIYKPGPREALGGAAASKDMLLVSILDNVRGRTLVYRPGPNGSWTRSALELPDNSTLAITDTSRTDNQAILAVTSFLTPPSLWLADAATGKAREIMGIQRGACFSAREEMRAEVQRYIVSAFHASAQALAHSRWTGTSPRAARAR